MTEHQREREVPKVEEKKSWQYPYQGVLGIVTKNIAAVMQDRKHMAVMEQDLDTYIKTLSDENKQEQRAVVTKQLTDGRLALESLLQRFLSS